MAQAADTGFIIENCENVFPFYLCSNPGQPRRTCFYDDKGNKKGTLSVLKDGFDNLDDKDGSKIDGILIHVPANGFQYVVTKECPVMKSSTHTWLFPNAEPEVEGKQADVDVTGKDGNDSNYHCFGITFPADVDAKILEAFDKALEAFCEDYREASCELLSKDALGSNVDGMSTIKELVDATAELSKTLMNKTSVAVSAELEKRPQLKAKVEKSKELANKAKDTLKAKMKEAGLKDRFFKAKSKLTKESKDMKDDLKKGDTKSVEDKFDRGTQSTVEFIQLVSRKGQAGIQSVKTVLIQRMPEYAEPKPNANGDDGKNDDSKQGQAVAKAPTKVDPKVMQGLDKAKQGTAFVGQVGKSVVTAVAIGAGHAVKSIGKEVEKNEAVSKQIGNNPIAYGNIKVIGKKTLHSYITISNELENACLFLFSESAHAAADIAEHKHGQEVGKAAHDTADVAVNIVSIFRLDNELIYGTIQEATRDDPVADPNAGNANAGGAAAGPAAADPNAAVQAAVGQAVMASLIQTNMQSMQSTNNANKY